MKYFLFSNDDFEPDDQYRFFIVEASSKKAASWIGPEAFEFSEFVKEIDETTARASKWPWIT